ncbi:50S ribosomal protein L24 [Haliangium ochraceum]|uniref:Large ribosomal subunit protein uL24 n=1 Tax=Haliangium ochraceum (strain DSM 14365 / JCM 11303 / SMP-2) TaxID=502025 RepID=D0LIB4_HALO1|nr:50S ribosomal protein L24 [Haliangium ochraceum]ACY16493.1 ribosomal protein L24 [Haliangium ochraceum DSM 14365]
MSKTHVRRGDMVVVTKGKDKGKRGAVKRVLTNGRIEVEKVNMVKRHTKPTQTNPHGGIIEQEGSIAIANVALWCDACSAGRRARRSVDESGNKSRLCTQCAGEFSNPGL